MGGTASGSMCVCYPGCVHDSGVEAVRHCYPSHGRKAVAVVLWGDERPSIELTGDSMKRLVLFLLFVWVVLAVGSYLGGML